MCWCSPCAGPHWPEAPGPWGLGPGPQGSLDPLPPADSPALAAGIPGPHRPAGPPPVVHLAMGGNTKGWRPGPHGLGQQQPGARTPQSKRGELGSGLLGLMGPWGEPDIRSLKRRPRSLTSCTCCRSRSCWSSGCKLSCPWASLRLWRRLSTRFRSWHSRCCS